VKQNENESWQIYDKATNQLNTELMWTFYIKACLERLELTPATHSLTQQRVTKTTSVFDRALSNGCLSEEMFMEWVTVLLRTGQTFEASTVCQKACQHYSKSVAVWRQRISVHVAVQGDDTLQLLQQALNAVPEKESLPIWELAVEWCSLNYPGHAKTLLKQGVTKSGDVGEACKEMYLEWAGLQADIHAARDIYTRLSSSKPLSVEFFTKYINIESCQPTPKMKLLRSAYEDAVQEFGNSETDLWMEYIKLELNHPKGKPENAGKLYWRAMKTLDDSLAERFIAQYTLVQTGHLK
jgi:U3 small nucleolar RNA-associated protein 6